MSHVLLMAYFAAAAPLITQATKLGHQQCLTAFLKFRSHVLDDSKTEGDRTQALEEVLRAVPRWLTAACFQLTNRAPFSSSILQEDFDPAILTLCATGMSLRLQLLLLFPHRFVPSLCDLIIMHDLYRRGSASRTYERVHCRLAAPCVLKAG